MGHQPVGDRTQGDLVPLFSEAGDPHDRVLGRGQPVGLAHRLELAGEPLAEQLDEKVRLAPDPVAPWLAPAHAARASTRVSAARSTPTGSPTAPMERKAIQRSGRTRM